MRISDWSSDVCSSDLVCVGLWSGWKENAFPDDKATGVYADPEKVSSLNHKGRFYQVRGPLNIMTPPQGRPLLVHAGQSEGGRDLAARYADAIFADVRTKAARQELRSEEHTYELQSLMRNSYAVF